MCSAVDSDPADPCWTCVASDSSWCSEVECSLVRFLLGWFLKSLSVAPTAGVNEWVSVLFLASALFLEGGVCYNAITKRTH